MTHPNRDEFIRQRAFELWQSEGCPDGLALEFWLRAERELTEPTPAALAAKPKRAAAKAKGATTMRKSAKTKA
jgi:hypothetical protein